MLQKGRILNEAHTVLALPPHLALPTCWRRNVQPKVVIGQAYDAHQARTAAKHAAVRRDLRSPWKLKAEHVVIALVVPLVLWLSYNMAAAVARAL